jgi:N-acetylmuramoyl-L-alanine amidase
MSIKIFMVKYFSFSIFFSFLIIIQALAQKPFFRLESPTRDSSVVTNVKQFITGNVGESCLVTINGNSVKVYQTGVFVFQANLVLGQNVYNTTVSNGDKTVEKKIIFNYQMPVPIKETDSFIIEKITVEPSGDVAIKKGEYLLIKVKAKPNCTLVMNDKYVLTELPKSQTKGIAGNYQLNYKIKAEDNFLLTKLKFDLLKNRVKKDTKLDKNVYSIFNEEEPMIGITKVANTPIYSGLGEDRLGGTKAGFLDSLVQLEIIGRVNKLYKVKLNNFLSVYIPTDNIEVLENGNAIPKSLSNNVGVNGDSLYDYVRISFNCKLPYLSDQNTKPNQIIVDVYGATINSNWVMQYPETLQEIEEVKIAQIQDGLLRVSIDLKNKQLWGYKMYYEGNTLVVKVRRQKQNISLKNMTIAIDAGHGGSNDGAKGIAGKYEKEFTLLMAKELRDLLESEGAKIVMTREEDISYENQERLKKLRQQMPDFALSIHLNSAGDPLRVKGASTYYKYNAFKNLSTSIYKRIKETGLNGWGNTGNFNFFLNSPTEFPNALIECLFISNPEDEEKVHNPTFRTAFCKKIVEGIKDWLIECAINK